MRPKFFIPIALLTLFFLFCFPSPTLAGGVYYVSPDGNDSNSGSISSPWLTLEYAARKAGPGDLVYVRAGTYYPLNSIQLSSNNPSYLPVVFMAFPGESVVVDGSRMPPGKDIFLVRGQYYEIRGFEIQFSTRTGINLYEASHVRVIGNIIHDSQQDGINGGGGTSYLHVENNIIFNNCRDNDEFQHEHQGGWSSAVKTSDFGDVIRNNLIYENWGEGIGATGSNHTISHNILHDNYSIEIYADNLAYSTISNNFVFSNNLPQFMRLYPNGVTASASGITFANESSSNPIKLDQLLVINNIVVGKRNWGLSLWSGCGAAGLRNSTIANNTFVIDGVSGVVRLDNVPSENNLIANNIFFQQNSDNTLAILHTVSGFTFLNNHWYGSETLFYGESGTSPTDIFAEPLFVNIQGKTAEDFKLKPGSPDIDSGLFLENVCCDFWNDRRIGMVDIGAHEFNPATSSMFLPVISGR